jgi:SAM-dependent methyltransferase
VNYLTSIDLGKCHKMPINYSDGVEVESFILSLVQEADRLGSSENIGKANYDRWPVRYHLSSQRANLVRHLDWSGLRVLEVGAGMGAVSRYIAERCEHLTVVEGTQARYDVLTSRLRDLSNWDGLVANFEDVPPTPEYDVVCLFGVLEYAELYVKPTENESPFLTMLKRAKKWLNPGGIVLVAIENRLGLKYFAGCGEDHTSGVFDGICGYSPGVSPRTFSRTELKEVLAAAGLPAITEQFPYPDYKLPSCVMTEKMLDGHGPTAVELASFNRAEDYSHPGNTLYPCSLVLESLQDQPHWLKEFSNSFLFLAGSDAESPILKNLLKPSGTAGEMAWHYTRNRAIQTVFRQSGGGLITEKRTMDGSDSLTVRYADEVVDIEWRQTPASPVTVGKKLMRELVRLAYFEEFDDFLNLISDFFSWTCERFEIENDPKHVNGFAFDAHPGNAFIVGQPDRYALFDQEWSLNGPMRKSWLLLRMLFGSDADLIVMIVGQWGSIAKLYDHLCGLLGVGPNLDEDLRSEAHLAYLLGSDELSGTERSMAERAHGRPPEAEFPRTRSELQSGDSHEYRKLRSALDAEASERTRLTELVQELHRWHQRKIFLLPRMIDQLIIRLKR